MAEGRAVPTIETEETQRASLPIEGRVRKLVNYLYQVAADELVTPQMALLAWQVWNNLSDARGNSLPVPDACPGPDGQMLYSWEHGEHYLELEIFPDRPAEFFYQNDANRQVWEATYLVGKPLSDEMPAKLRLFS